MANDSVSASDQPGLVERIRRGDDAAFGELFQAHEAAVRRLARGLSSDASEAEDVTAETFFRVLQAIRRGNGPRDNVRAYLLTVARRVSWEWQAARREVPVTDEELVARAGAGGDAQSRTAESSLITRAFTSLPERWRTVLWRTEVEGQQPAVVAPHFGLSANATAALARRARIGLRAAYLQAHLATDHSSAACLGVVRKLGGYTAGSVTGAEAHKIRSHLSVCSSCRSTHDELRRVCSSLRAHASVLVPLVPLSGLTLAGSYAGSGAGAAVAAGGSATASGLAVGGMGSGATTAATLTGSKLGLTFASAAAVVGMSGVPVIGDMDGGHGDTPTNGDGGVVTLSSSAADDRRSSMKTAGSPAMKTAGSPADEDAGGRDGTGSIALPAESSGLGPTEFLLPAEAVTGPGSTAADLPSEASSPPGRERPSDSAPPTGRGTGREVRQEPAVPRDDTSADPGTPAIGDPRQPGGSGPPGQRHDRDDGRDGSHPSGTKDQRNDQREGERKDPKANRDAAAPAVRPNE
ncbi:sigma-70 family RNA polymerase sigma factor [Saccharomonospora xinjiangensis]|uniref:RNA polymerase sigma factor, sigma-70 family n=1 Tax=Saccharomonospora xinjiangensis XJ-54 TaxID=882086 RepID=I0V263_9PSEU|nr:sigma-70 family RNA polymerase sigma factor [Saccharomonospora xinjiangensis]EID54216.1 RNA polymerase sigma factor, sigma-70 family [Saccharomonospora xinjiangensis XJ-54]